MLHICYPLSSLFLSLCKVLEQGKQGMEEVAMSRKRPLLVKEKLGGANGESSGHGFGGEPTCENSSPVTFVLAFSAFIAICGCYSFGNAMGYTSPAESGILNDLGLTLAEFSFFGSVLTIGALIGAAVSGKMADLIGRRGAMCVSDVFCIAGWLAITLSKGALLLDIGRLSVGFGIGCSIYVVSIYLAEITPHKLRGAVSSLNTLMISSSISATFIIGSYISWRSLALLGAIPCTIQLLGLPFIPESPRWLAKVGRENDLEAALLRLRGKNADVSVEAAEIIEYTERLAQITEDGFKDLFQRKYSRAVIVGIGLMVLQQFGGTSSYTSYLSFILESAGFPGAIGSIAASIIQISGNIVCLILIDKFGRRPLLLVSAVGMCLGSLMTGLSFLLKDYHLWKEVPPILALIGSLTYIGCVCAGLGGIAWLIMSEIFPGNIKATGGSFTNLVNWSTSWIVTYTFNFLFQWSSAGVFFIYSICAFLGVIFVAKLVPETKGKTLEEIQASITR